MAKEPLKPWHIRFKERTGRWPNGADRKERRVRRLRDKAHHLLDPLWKEGLISRDDAYTLVRRLLGIKHKGDGHIKYLPEGQLYILIDELESGRFFTYDQKVAINRLNKKSVQKLKRFYGDLEA